MKLYNICSSKFLRRYSNHAHILSKITSSHLVNHEAQKQIDIDKVKRISKTQLPKNYMSPLEYQGKMN